MAWKQDVCVRVLSHQFTRERPRCRIIKGVTFIDKTEINRAEVRVQTVGQDKQGYIKQRQNRHGCQGRTLTVPPLQWTSTLGEGILGRTGLIKDKGGTNWGAGGEERLEVQYSQETQGMGLGGQKIVQGNILELPKKVVS